MIISAPTAPVAPTTPTFCVGWEEEELDMLAGCVGWVEWEGEGRVSKAKRSGEEERERGAASSRHVLMSCPRHIYVEPSTTAKTISISSTCTPRCACLVCEGDFAVTCMAASDHKVALHSARGRQAW